MTIYIDIRNTRSITAICHYGEHHYVGCDRWTFEKNHEIVKNDYYSCNALPEQQFEPICEYCPGNKHRKYMNEMRLVDNSDAKDEE